MNALLRSDTVRDGSATARAGHGTAARLAFEEAERFYESASPALGDETVRQGLSHLAAAFEPTEAKSPSPSSTFGSVGDAPADD